MIIIKTKMNCGGEFFDGEYRYESSEQLLYEVAHNKYYGDYLEVGIPEEDSDVCFCDFNGKELETPVSFSKILGYAMIEYGKSLCVKDELETIPSKKLRVKVSGGMLEADASTDPDYPGIDVEYVPDDLACQRAKKSFYTLPRVLVEKNEIEDALRALVWNDPKSEDYSEEIVFQAGENKTINRLQTV